MRRSRDFYETASWQVDALTDHRPGEGGGIGGFPYACSSLPPTPICLEVA